MTHKDAIVTIGYGDVTQNRVRPAQRQLFADGLLHSVAYLDIFPAPGETFAEDELYSQIEDQCLLPWDELDRHGLLGPHVLVLVNTPTRYHTLYAKQFVGTGCSVAVDKPLTGELAAATSLLAFEDMVFPIGHQLFKANMLSFLEQCEEMPELLQQLTALDFTLWETRDVGHRAIDNAVWDLGWHGFECIIAPLRAAGSPAELSVTRTRVATYEPPAGGLRPAVYTAAYIEGSVHFDSYAVPYRIRVGKGLAEEHKQLVLRCGVRDEPVIVSLAESGWRAHYRVLRELLTATRPDLKLSLADTVAVVQLCAQADRLAVDEGTYSFGTTPGFMTSVAFCE